MNILLMIASLNLFASNDYGTFRGFGDVQLQYKRASVVSTKNWRHRVLRAGRCFSSEYPNRARGAALAHKRDSSGVSLIAITWAPFDYPVDRYERMSLEEYESLGVEYSVYSLGSGEFFHQEAGLVSSLRSNQRFVFEELREAKTSIVFAYCVYRSPYL